MVFFEQEIFEHSTWVTGRLVARGVDLSHVSHVGHVCQVAHFLHVAHVEQGVGFSQVSHVGHVWQVAHFLHVAHIGQVWHVWHVGHGSVTEQCRFLMNTCIYFIDILDEKLLCTSLNASKK